MKYWLETLGCPKNQVDSDKLVGQLEAKGYGHAGGPGDADLILVNTCAFIEAARQESIDMVLEVAGARRPGSRLVVTGCMAERYGEELAAALPEVDQVAGFGVAVTEAVEDARSNEDARRNTVPVSLGTKPVPSFDLLNLPRPPSSSPWAYLKVAEGCNRSCGFCAIPAFRGRQRSRTHSDLLAEVEVLDVKEIVLVAQDLASYGVDIGRRGAIADLVRDVAAKVERTRLLYLYPSQLDESLIEAMAETNCAYFDLSLQHVSRPHLRRMRRWGDGVRFAQRIAQIRRRYSDAAFRSSFILGYPGETEEDHDQLLRFLEEQELDWAGFFPFSPEEGTYAVDLPAQVPPALAGERLAECGELQDQITARRRRELVGATTTVLIDRPGIGRSHREAPEIDGVIRVPPALAQGSMVEVMITSALGVDLEATPVAAELVGAAQAMNR